MFRLGVGDNVFFKAFCNTTRREKSEDDEGHRVRFGDAYWVRSYQRAFGEEIVRC